ncbi:hypothetical protein CCP3SC1_70035 [Gammaproteobacteria bacterium]
MFPSLMSFCGGRHDRPIKRENFLYFTDGTIIVRHEYSGEGDFIDGSIPKFSNIDKIFSHVLYDEKYRIGDIVKDPKMTVCKMCEGTGNLMPCRECGGDEVFFVSSGFNDYEVTCKTCKGELIEPYNPGYGGPSPMACGLCEGDGKLEEIIPISIGGYNFSNKYLRKIMNSGGSYLSSVDDSGSPRIYFEINGSVGCLAAMNIKSLGGEM